MSDEKNQRGLLKSLMDLPFIKKLKSIKHIEIIILVIFFLILLLICFGGGIINTSSNNTIEANTSTYNLTTKEYVEDVENKLKRMLQSMKDVGNVEVMVSVSGNVQIMYLTDQTTSVSGQTTENIVLVDSKPVVLSEKLPEINGIIIISSGAKNTKVKLDIISAVQTLIDIASSKIQVFVGN